MSTTTNNSELAAAEKLVKEQHGSQMRALRSMGAEARAPSCQEQSTDGGGSTAKPNNSQRSAAPSGSGTQNTTPGAKANDDDLSKSEVGTILRVPGSETLTMVLPGREGGTYLGTVYSRGAGWYEIQRTGEFIRPQ